MNLTRKHWTDSHRAMADEICAAKKAAGRDAYLWAHDSGDVILWPCGADSVNDDGHHAVGRWQVSAETRAQLVNSGDVDEVA